MFAWYVTADLLDEVCGVWNGIPRRIAGAWSSGKPDGWTRELSPEPLFEGSPLQGFEPACGENRVSGKLRSLNGPVGFLGWMSGAKDHKGRAARYAPGQLARPSSRWRFPRANRLGSTGSR